MWWNYFGLRHGKGDISTFVWSHAMNFLFYRIHSIFFSICNDLKWWILICCHFMFFLGEWDGARAVVKWRLRAEQIMNLGWQLQNARHVVDFLTKHLSSRISSSFAQSTTKDISCYFWHMGENDVHRSNLYDCKTLPGSSKLHSVRGFSRIDPTQLMIQQVLYFCNAYIDSQWNKSENKSHI